MLLLFLSHNSILYLNNTFFLFIFYLSFSMSVNYREQIIIVTMNLSLSVSLCMTFNSTFPIKNSTSLKPIRYDISMPNDD